MKLAFTQLHSPIFHAGKNFKDKISHGPDTQLELVTRKIDGFVIPFVKVTHNNLSTLLPLTSINHITEVGDLQTPSINISHAMDVNKIKTAQVSTPTDHVFQTSPGKTGKPGKIQGE